MCENQALRDLAKVVRHYGMQVETVSKKQALPGSFWGDSEAGLIGNTLYVRSDTPIHSALHEACHYICMDAGRRQGLHTDAGGGYDEENGVCYLQILLADHFSDYSRNQMQNEMDAWGYSFRLGSAKAWFEKDAEDALQWLQQYGIVDSQSKPTWRQRDDTRT